MQVTEHALFPTRLVTIQFDAPGLNEEVARRFATGDEFAGDFDMHPDSQNLLVLADRWPAIGRLRTMFLDGLRVWLRGERAFGELATEMVLFSNYAARGEFTLVHNHEADVAGIYYVTTAEYDRPALVVADPAGEYDYFAAEDGVLVLHDPRFNANLGALGSADYAKVYPRPGLMLIFPGFLWHSVTPHLGEFRRLAISANFRLRSSRPSNAETWSVVVDKS
ncbi:MAG: hypothetical protein QOD06_1846 [Candidatus Binatota bacterium]|nr:hypothetical protein [Candidatus Binatota bacterium]